MRGRCSDALVLSHNISECLEWCERRDAPASGDGKLHMDEVVSVLRPVGHRLYDTSLMRHQNLINSKRLPIEGFFPPPVQSCGTTPLNKQRGTRCHPGSKIVWTNLAEEPVSADTHEIDRGTNSLLADGLTGLKRRMEEIPRRPCCLRGLDRKGSSAVCGWYARATSQLAPSNHPALGLHGPSRHWIWTCR
ncbi:uncharacterized protein BKA78DRAFT_3445 [Phyllosticta capitalensis]|uniref:uncharacterized protein n=1 Tax=Phyllosticta capitalensis TaxID=121624 RepID=UPI003130A8A3